VIFRAIVLCIKKGEESPVQMQSMARELKRDIETGFKSKDGKRKELKTKRIK